MLFLAIIINLAAFVGIAIVAAKLNRAVKNCAKCRNHNCKYRF